MCLCSGGQEVQNLGTHIWQGPFVVSSNGGRQTGRKHAWGESFIRNLFMIMHDEGINHGK
jgi:hypothetical protein